MITTSQIPAPLFCRLLSDFVSMKIAGTMTAAQARVTSQEGTLPQGVGRAKSLYMVQAPRAFCVSPRVARCDPPVGITPRSRDDQGVSFPR